MSAFSSDTSDERGLWRAVQQGDPKAFQQLYETYVDMLYNYGCKLSQQEALVQDAMQEVFLILWEKREQLQITRSLKQYLFTMMRREVIDRLQRQQKQDDHLPEVEFQLSVEDRLIDDESQHELRQELTRGIQALTPRQREILFLRYYESLSYEEISELMSLNLNSLYKLLSAAIKRLRLHLTSLLVGMVMMYWI